MNRSLRLHALDGWRGICALLVVIFHFQAIGYYSELPLVQNARLAVDFFFVLSGFVITHAYGGRVQSWQDFRIFIARRLGRIYPMHLLTLGVMVAMHAAMVVISPHVGKGEYSFATPNDASSIIGHIFLMHSMGIFEDHTWNAPSWSISVEFYVYIVFALLLLLLRKYLTVAAVLLFLTGMTVLWLYSPAYFAAHLDYGFWRCLAGFSVGHLVYRLRLRYSGRTQPSYRTNTELQIVAVAAVLLLIWNTPKGSPLSMVTPLAFGAVVYVFATGDGLVSRGLSTRPLQFLGTYSYSIYIVHNVIVYAMAHVTYIVEHLWNVTLSSPTSGHRFIWQNADHPWLMDLLLLAYLAVTIKISVWCYRRIENPSRQWFNTRWAYHEERQGSLHLRNGMW